LWKGGGRPSARRPPKSRWTPTGCEHTLSRARTRTHISASYTRRRRTCAVAGGVRRSDLRSMRSSTRLLRSRHRGRATTCAENGSWLVRVVALEPAGRSHALRRPRSRADLQPGPEGGGVDRRIPFPELPGNDSFQLHVCTARSDELWSDAGMRATRDGLLSWWCACVRVRRPAQVWSRLGHQYWRAARHPPRGARQPR
jgi:hypothetical protein